VYVWIVTNWKGTGGERERASKASVTLTIFAPKFIAHSFADEVNLTGIPSTPLRIQFVPRVGISTRKGELTANRGL
jgi:hypothetical protein